MKSTNIAEESLSKEMIALLEEFSACFQWEKAGKLIPKINLQGKKDGLSRERIRELIFLHFKGGLGDRQLRRLLPLELKYSEFANKKKNAASKADIMSAPAEQASMKTLKIKPRAETEHQEASTDHAAIEETCISPNNDLELVESLYIRLRKEIHYLKRKLEEKSPKFPELRERIRVLEGIERERIRHIDFRVADSI